MAQEHTPRTWKSDQERVITEVEADLRKAFKAARAKAEAAGVRRDVEQGAFCFKCSCQQFLPKDPLNLELGGGDHPFTPCRRGVCGHDFLSHYIY